MKPSPEFEQHHDLAAIGNAAIRSALRVSTRLEQIYLGHDIDDAEFAAGTRYRDAYEVAQGARDQSDITGIKSAPGPSTPGQRQINAVALLRHIRAEVGDLAAWLLDECVAKDASFREMARASQGSDRRVKAAVIVAVGKLTVALANWDARRR